MATSTDLTLAQTAAQAPGQPHPSCIWRWARKGVKARNGQVVRLRHYRSGNRIYIPDGALEEFLETLNSADVAYFNLPPEETAPRNRTAALRAREVAAAQARVAARGV